MSLYEKILSNVNSGKWEFTLSIIHISEAIKRKDKNSREDLLNLMYTLSKGCSICNSVTANIIEFNYWIEHGKVDILKVQNNIIDNDLLKIVGLSTNNAIVYNKDCCTLPDNVVQQIKNIMLTHSCDKKLFDLICSNCNLNQDEDFYYNCLSVARDQFNTWKNKLMKLNEYKPKHLYPSYLSITFFEEYKDLINKFTLFC